MNDLIKINFKLPSVDFSKEQLKEMVEESIEQYKGFINTDDMEMARKAVRKVIKDIDEQRLSITRMWDDTKKSFMADVKEALDPAHQLADHYGRELDLIEAGRKAEKLEEIKQLDGAQMYLEYQEMDDRWLNKSYKLDTIQEEITQAVDNINRDIDTLKTAATMVGFEPDKYCEMLKQKPLNEVLTRLHEDKQLIDSRETKTEPKPEPVLSNEIVTVTLEFTGDKAMIIDVIENARQLGVKVVRK